MGCVPRFPTKPIADDLVTMPADADGVGWIEQLVRMYAEAIAEDVAVGCFVLDVQRRLRQFHHQVGRLAEVEL